MQAEFALWRHSAESQGWRVSSAGISGGGFPFGRDTENSPELTLSGGQALVPGGVDWHAQRVVLSLPLLHPWRLQVAPQGQQVVRAAAGQAVVLNADTLFAQVPLGGGRPDHIRIEAAGLTAGMRGSGNPQDVRIDGLDLQLLGARGGGPHAPACSCRCRRTASGCRTRGAGRWGRR